MSAATPDLGPRVSRREPSHTLEHHTSGAYCTTCRRKLGSTPAAISWALDHARDTGHRVKVDYHARYVVEAPEPRS